jgi:hypothetical protein
MDPGLLLGSKLEVGDSLDVRVVSFVDICLRWYDEIVGYTYHMEEDERCMY